MIQERVSTFLQSSLASKLPVSWASVNEWASGDKKEQIWSNKKAEYQGEQHTNLGQFVGVFSKSFSGGGGSNRRRGVEAEVEAFFKNL